MAIITTIKNYEFCDDIFKHILSYTGYKKPMTTIGKRLLTDEFQEIFNQHHRVVNQRIMESDKADVKLIYRLRMFVSYEQLQFEQTAIGKVAMKNYKDYLDTFGVVNCVHLGGWFHHSGVCMWNYILRMLRGWDWYWRDGDAYKSAHLTQICDAGKTSSKHHIKLEKQSIRNAKRREVVSCECCGKMLTRGSLTRHTKKCSVV
jgi:hypothetical protein